MPNDPMAHAAGAPGEGGQAARVSSPPGLEGAAALEGAEAVKAALVREIDDKVAAKVDEFWQKGKVMLSHVLKKQQESSERLAAEIAKCLEKQAALERENGELKQVLLNLSGRFGVLSSVLSGGAAATAECGGGSGVFGSPCGGFSGAAAAGVLAGTPVTAKAESFGGGETLPLPEVPPFPFPAAAPHTTMPLCLAEALGGSSRSPPGTPVPPASGGSSALGGNKIPPQQPPMALSLANSLHMSPPPPEVFSFTLRKADGKSLGLNVNEDERVLVVEGIRVDGAVDAWNRQCMGGTCPGKVVKRGDKIIRVNDIENDPAGMLEECKEKRLLRLTIFRGDGPLPEAADAAGGRGSATAMRAEASEFVPRSAPGEAAAPTAPPEAARTASPAPPS